MTGLVAPVIVTAGMDEIDLLPVRCPLCQLVLLLAPASASGGTQRMEDGGVPLPADIDPLLYHVWIGLACVIGFVQPLYQGKPLRMRGHHLSHPVPRLGHLVSRYVFSRPQRQMPLQPIVL